MMKRPNLIIGIGVGVAITHAVALVVLYVQGTKGEPVDSESVTVIVSKKDIPSLTPLTLLISDGLFVEVEIPPDLLVEGTVTDLRQLDGAMTTAVIFMNEQIPISRLMTVDPSISLESL